METSKKNKWLYAGLSILIAVILWMYVGKVVNPEVDGTVRNLPVTFVGLDVLEERGLMIADGADQTVTISVKGKRDVVNQLSAETVSITVDVSSIAQTGTYTQAYQIVPSLSGAVASSSLIITDRHPLNVEFTVAKLAVRTVSIQGSFTGSVADGYQAGEFSFSPATLEIRGEESIVNQIDFVQVVLDKENLAETYSGDLPYTFISFGGEVVDGTDLETSVPLIRTTLPIVQLKEVPLTVNILAGGGATEENITYTISPKTIIVSGAASDLEPLKEVSLGNIDLSKVLGSDVLTFPISLTSELSNVSGITEATVDISVKGLSTKTLEVDNIELINIPSGCSAQSVTQSRQVQIRGEENAVAGVSASQLRIVADLTQAVAATGTQTVPVKVYLDGRSDVGVVGEYNIVVSISR
ncbi:MAG: CdaR family protein [Pseudoflavonifractor sp.]|nr:CdaR family protein [Pseudoflavonifractor sp.]